MMKYNSDKHHNRSIRLRGYDYSQAGAYYVTICTQKRLCLFGDVRDNDDTLWVNGRLPIKTNNKMRPKSISSLIAGFQSPVPKQINILRDENNMNRIRRYITNNPANWDKDEHYA